ncbi:MAG: hypothetical protein HAW67_02245 [Endozoicomonadaceae bacterium]|nr:hypothetical protein [Endozoicomonadaceae bacterium]
MNRNFATVFALSIIGISFFSYQYFDIGKKSITIWEKKADNIKDTAYISKIAIYEESCNEIIYEVFYENVKNKPKEISSLGISHKDVNSGYAKNEDGTLDYSLWISSEGGKGLRGIPLSELKDGKGSIKYRGWITPETQSAETYGFHAFIRSFDDKDNQINHFDQVEIKHTKLWDNSCR